MARRYVNRPREFKYGGLDGALSKQFPRYWSSILAGGQRVNKNIVISEVRELLSVCNLLALSMSIPLDKKVTVIRADSLIYPSPAIYTLVINCQAPGARRDIILVLSLLRLAKKSTKESAARVYNYISVHKLLDPHNSPGHYFIGYHNPSGPLGHLALVVKKPPELTI
ncbi:hypothetical protein P175DRAFT_0533005 [Aspergillus ochraceoroseus IBT 24754]|uniref:Uncharacterized protein n=1 Tax=Aspergillus ochraceoroseus IBT 24754 TaxID=1392256 RepID=A0A2T5LUS3_9EURO|nr:uncharacterized protein P175DRAFT_0533005 [Aspergillus ochraceoroseus IBT 24754]PTU20035.1 hypothetical protein P175DRAFT_0533005 [Aspergillus ochraceoroseus IBT 24754]